MDMGVRRMSAGLHVFALLCLAISLGASDAAAQAFVASETSLWGASSGRPLFPSGSACQKDGWSAPSVHVGWMTTPTRIHLGYDGLVLPGACISSVFVYPLSGVQVGASLPVRFSDDYALRAYGAYLFPHGYPASQELTWTNSPPGVREWRHSNTEFYRLGAEMLYQMSGRMALVGGFRWESLLTTFGDANPDYQDTVPSLQAQTTIATYEPYLGIRLQQHPGPGGLTVQVIGFPAMFATIQHLNVCHNVIPYAHTGSHATSRGYFLEASAEWNLGLFRGAEGSAFVEWTTYYGQCPMTIQRHEGGANPATTSGTVQWAHRISSLVIGGKVQIAWNLPF
jgi:hypothetical protein